MLQWQADFDDLNASVIATFGQPVIYSRPDSPNLDAIAPFTINADVETGGEYASPKGPLFGSVLVLIADIPFGPQRGDLLVPTVTSFSLIAGRTYRVDEIFLDATEGSATLKIRWTGQ